MANPIRYEELYFNASDDSESLKFKLYLDSNSIKYEHLFYAEGNGQENLTTISGWFQDKENPGSTIQFTKYPFLIFEKVFWESPDKSDVYKRRDFSKSIEDLPLEFSSLSVKTN